MIRPPKARAWVFGVATSNVNGSGIFNVQASPYNAAGNTRMVTDGAISNASSTFTSATGAFTSGDIGKVICVRGAISGGSPLVTTILAVGSSTSITLTAGATNTVSGAICHFGTDDTAAVQAAITAAYNNGGGVVFFPKAIYMINGAFQNSSTHNAQLIVPDVALNSQPISIALVGVTQPVIQVPGPTVLSNNPPSTTGSIIFSPRNGSGSNPSLFAAWKVNSSDDFSVVQISVANLTFRSAYLNTTPLTMLQLSSASWAQVESCYFDVDATSTQIGNTQPVSGGLGLNTPSTDNGAFNVARDCYAIGYDTGFKWCEHGVFDNMQAYFCHTAFEVVNAYHALFGNRIGAYSCKQGILASGTTVDGATRVPLIIDEFNTEHSTVDWFSSPVDVVDSNNVINGKMTYNVVVSSVGYSNGSFSKTGGSNFTCTALF